jgi:hypothetical protein
VGFVLPLGNRLWLRPQQRAQLKKSIAPSHREVIHFQQMNQPKVKALASLHFESAIGMPLDIFQVME